MQSMEEIYEAHSRTVYRYLLAQTRDAGLSEELTQETFYQAVRSAGRFDGSCKVSTWLCAIAKNVLSGYRRKNPPAQPLEDELPGADSPESAALAAEDRLELLKLLHTLWDDMREVMYLRLLGEASFHEIGDVMGKTENWARVTYFRGREKLKKELEQNGK